MKCQYCRTRNIPIKQYPLMTICENCEKLLTKIDPRTLSNILKTFESPFKQELNLCDEKYFRDINGDVTFTSIKPNGCDPEEYWEMIIAMRKEPVYYIDELLHRLPENLRQQGPAFVKTFAGLGGVFAVQKVTGRQRSPETTLALKFQELSEDFTEEDQVQLRLIDYGSPFSDMVQAWIISDDKLYVISCFPDIRRIRCDKYRAFVFLAQPLDTEGKNFLAPYEFYENLDSSTREEDEILPGHIYYMFVVADMGNIDVIIWNSHTEKVCSRYNYDFYTDEDSSSPVFESVKLYSTGRGSRFTVNLSVKGHNVFIEKPNEEFKQEISIFTLPANENNIAFSFGII